MGDKLQGADTDMVFLSGDVNPNTILLGGRELDQTQFEGINPRAQVEHEAIESPQRLRRTISREEAEIIKRMVANLRYVDEWDDSMFFTAAQAFQAEAQKLRKRPIKGPRGNDRKEQG